MLVPRLRVRTLMAVVAVVAILIWGAMLGSRSYKYYRLAREYGFQAWGWREIAARHQYGRQAFEAECAEYFTQLAAKYRRAMWRPWLPVAPDPYAPGNREWQEQERKKREARSL
jgi:hypothetical protein